MASLVDVSIKVILQNQNDLGAYIACPNFKDYRYCWLRDGSFIAYAMLRVGRPESTKMFLRWVNGVILRYRHKVDGLAFKQGSNDWLLPNDFLHARHTMEGFELHDDWPNFQIDGYGAWLWCLAEYIKHTGDHMVLQELEESVSLTIEYLSRVWRLPNYDCWEENGDSLHPATLASVYGGIRSINRFRREPKLHRIVRDIRKLLLDNLVEDGRLPKSIGSNSVDASLIWASIPFEVLSPDNPIMKRTIRSIEHNLVKEGGVQRYPEDTYFGGGQWILLTSWLGWYYARLGMMKKARRCLLWVEQRVDEEGNLPEQDLTITNDPAFIGSWEKRAGEVAKPLLWSHAMYLILFEECKVPRSNQEIKHDKLLGGKQNE